MFGRRGSVVYATLANATTQLDSGVKVNCIYLMASGLKSIQKAAKPQAIHKIIPIKEDKQTSKQAPTSFHLFCFLSSLHLVSFSLIKLID